MGVNHDTGKVDEGSVINQLSVNLFSGVQTLVNLVQGISPVDALSSGRSITWAQLGRSFAQTVLLIGGICAAIGITILTKREIALPT